MCGAPAGSIEAHRELGYLAELFRFPDWCTGDELLVLHQKLAESEGGAAERAELLELVGLAEVGGRRIGTMRKGMQQRLGLAQALIGARACCCSTSRPARSTPPAAAPCARCWRSCAAAASPCCSTRTCCPRSSWCATAWRSSPAARWWPPARRPSSRTPAGWRWRPRAAPGCSRGAREDAPRIVRELVAAGEEVYGVRVLTSTLEDAYLEAVGGR